MSEILPGERRELRAVVRSQIKVLRAEVGLRKQELLASVETRLAERYRDEDAYADAFRRKLGTIAGEANRKLSELTDEYGEMFNGGQWGGRMSSGFTAPHIWRKQEDRDQLRKAMHAGIEAEAKSALLDLDRREADLLRDLAIDGLETAAARAFLERIPTVAELVPAARMREIETAFDQGGAR